MDLPWKEKGIVLTAPFTRDVDDVVKFIEEYLAPHGCNLIIMQTRYRYQFKRHPECQGYDPLSEQDIKRILYACKKHNIKLVPKINAVGHQSGLPNIPDDSILHGHTTEGILDIRDGLLRSYPELDEQPDAKSVIYSRSVCLSNPVVRIILCDIIDELLDVFEADTIHIGCDEIMNIGLCPMCKGKDNGELFADYINAIQGSVAKRGGKIMMWADRFLNANENEYGVYEASGNGTHTAITKVSKEIIMCDWHYGDMKTYPSVEVFAQNGFKMLLGLSHYSVESAKKFIEYAKEHDENHINGVLVTTWFGSGELARYVMYGKEEECSWNFRNETTDILRYVFE